MPIERWRYTLPLLWRALFRRRRADEELDEEIAYHVETEVEARVGAGMDPDEARRLVLRRLGGLERVKERCRDARGVIFVETFVQDLRFGARLLRRDPLFTAVAVLSLALGIGGNTAVFSLVDGVLLARLPYPSPDRLVSVSGTYPNGAFAAMRDEVRTMDVGAYAAGHAFTLTGAGEPARLEGARVSAELFTILGERPAIGRWPRPGEDLRGRDRVVVLSHGLWASRFGADPAVVGRFVEIDGESREVIAVTAPAFAFPSGSVQIWVPLGIDAGDTVRHWAGDYMPIVGRLRPDVTLAQAHAEVRLFQSRVTALFPWRMPDEWNRDVGVVPLQQALVGDVRPRLLILLGAVVLVLLIACANVTNLSLARAAARGEEMGLRTAIGAGPRRIARQLLTESVLLAAMGAVLGLALATQAIGALRLVLPADTPRLAEVHLSWRVLAFTGLLALVTGCAAGLVPAVQALRLRLPSLRSGARGGRAAVAGPFRTALTVAQIASSVLLVIAAGLLVRSLWQLSSVDPGFRADRILTARVSPPDALCESPARCLAFYDALEDRVRSEPGVADVALVNTLPLTGAVSKRSLELEGYRPADGTAPLFWLHAVSPSYFDVMQIRVESGRGFAPADRTGQPAVALVTASTARRFWPGQNPVGRHVRFVGEPDWHTIVGVVADVRAYDLTRDVPEWMQGTIYVPYGPRATREDGRIPAAMTLTVKTSGDTGGMGAVLARIASGLHGDVAVSDVRSMRAVVADSVAAPAATTSLLVTLAALALALGVTGVYGVLSFLVSTRTRDVGIRMALGAQRRDVFWLVMKEGARLCAWGVALGLAGAVATTGWLSSELYGVEPTDPATFAAVAAAVSLVTLTACYVPTRRAMRVDPLTVLRNP